MDAETRQRLEAALASVETWLLLTSRSTTAYQEAVMALQFLRETLAALPAEPPPDQD